MTSTTPTRVRVKAFGPMVATRGAHLNRGAISLKESLQVLLQTLAGGIAYNDRLGVISKVL